ncbi:GNAT family N-acetyltransferase [Rossellomorea sp. AcN35-11]|nr:GNAT family N-acetyltransferase [Rossellomorea aquimaris]NMH68153.1 GNAT family N-acetyltransferase [Bacillus sp. RO3]WJV29969.1 GNAT family N-acetyltransferase [Rossellomorea sp. AcN35-11]
MTTTVKELLTKGEVIGSYPVMKELRTDLSEAEYLALYDEMKLEGYRLFALCVDDEIVSLAGIVKRVNFYHKHHIFIYDLITSSNHRSKGYGKQLLEYIHTFAEESGADCVALDSGFPRVDAHRFYEEKMGYEKKSYSFRRKV